MINNYNDFIDTLLNWGFSMGGGNSEGILAVVPWNWDETPPYDTPVSWHTGNQETDPWEWRMRVLNERDDIAYGKIFFKKSGYITRDWYPYFLAARRGTLNFDEEYACGTVSHPAKRIYDIIQKDGPLPLHAIKPMAGFSKEEKSVFDRALTELQMKMYVTMCGSKQKLSKKGEEYGWSSTVFCTVEEFWGADIQKRSARIDKQEAAEAITAQVKKYNPDAAEKKILKFIKG